MCKEILKHILKNYASKDQPKNYIISNLEKNSINRKKKVDTTNRNRNAGNGRASHPVNTRKRPFKWGK